MEDRKSSKKRQVVLDAATAAFRDLGYDATSMDRVSELAGVSKRTVYNHFGSKEALFRAVVDQLIAHTHALEQIPWDPHRSLEEQLGEFAHAKARVATDPALSGLMRVVIGVFVRDPRFAQEAMARANAGEDALLRWLSAAHEAGRMRVPDAAVAAQQFWAMISGAVFWPTVLGIPSTHAEREAAIDESIATFLARFGT